MSGIIQPATSMELRKLSGRLNQVVKPPHMGNTRHFFDAYVEDPETYADDELWTIITAGSEDLAISVQRNLGNRPTLIFVNVDLQVEAPSVIVKPGLYEGKIGRPIVRALFESEGRALIQDLGYMITNLTSR